jgi:hypothetical protein
MADQSQLGVGQQHIARHSTNLFRAGAPVLSPCSRASNTDRSILLSINQFTADPHDPASICPEDLTVSSFYR